jgi:hypothetical protein
MSAALAIIPGNGRFLRPAARVRPSCRNYSSKAPAGAERSYAIPVWSGLISVKHRQAMGISVWMFLWCLDRITRDENGWGLVLGGKPVKDEEIARRLGLHKNSIHRDRDTLIRGNYVEAIRTPYGFRYRVRNSRKFGIWGKKRVTKSSDSLERESPLVVIPESPFVVETKKTMQLDHAVAAARQEETVWNFLKIRPCGPGSFRTFLESRWASPGGERRSVLIGESIDAWEAAEGERLPRCPSLFRALSELRSTEKSVRPQAEPKLRRIPTAADIRPKER